MDELTIASLLISRLCHDLAAPAGAVNNGLELLREEMPGGSPSASMDLVEYSAGETLNRLMFFRLAFGAAGGIGAMVPVSEAKTAASNYFDGHKVGLIWPPHAAGDLPQPVLKLLLNLILLAAEALPRGGNVRVETDRQALGVTATGEGAALLPERREALGGVTADQRIDARLIQAFYAGALGRAAGAAIDVGGDGTSFLTLGARFANPWPGAGSRASRGAK